MIKYFILLLIAIPVATQKINAQLDMAFFSNFSVTGNNSINRLSWTVTSNQGANKFEIERCTNGKDFETIAILFATEKFGTETYTFSDSATSQDKTMYRLRTLSRTQHVFYSKIVMIQHKVSLDFSLKIAGNPVRDRLSINYTSKNAEQAEVTVYDLCGNPVANQKINSAKGSNLISIPLNASLAPGMYVLEIKNSILGLSTKFIKQ